MMMLRNNTQTDTQVRVNIREPVIKAPWCPVYQRRHEFLSISNDSRLSVLFPHRLRDYSFYTMPHPFHSIQTRAVFFLCCCVINFDLKRPDWIQTQSTNLNRVIRQGLRDETVGQSVGRLVCKARINNTTCWITSKSSSIRIDSPSIRARQKDPIRVSRVEEQQLQSTIDCCIIVLLYRLLD